MLYFEKGIYDEDNNSSFEFYHCGAVCSPVEISAADKGYLPPIAFLKRT